MTLFVKLAMRNGEFTSFVVLTIAVAIVLYPWDFQGLKPADFVSTSALWSYAAGISLAVAVTSLFMALSLGPASVVVPIYGMFVIGGSVLAILFLGGTLKTEKVLGIVTTAASIYLITR